MIAARRAGVVCGLDFARLSFALTDPRIAFTAACADGDPIAAGAPLARLSGPVGATLSAERTALNFLTHLSGIATLTAAYVAAVKDNRASIVDTRKTLPGLRAAQKYAVRCGGGRNHRFGLHDGVMIKDNHIAAAGGIDAAMTHSRAALGHMVKICVEADTPDQAVQAAAAGADVILLDNMTPEALLRSVGLIDGRAITEASGGITLENIEEIAATGVDIISIGALTHSAPSLDIGLDILE